MMWRVMPPPLSPDSNPHLFYGNANPPIQNLFSSSFAGTQQHRRSRLLELHRISQVQGGKLTVMNSEASTESVLNCYLAIIFAYIWLHSFPSCLTFILFVVDKKESFIFVEMIALICKLVGFSVNAAIYFWLREDFNYAFSTLFTRICACRDMMKRKRTGPSDVGGGGTFGDEWY
jgi:hypothetical protein